MKFQCRAHACRKKINISLTISREQATGEKMSETWGNLSWSRTPWYFQYCVRHTVAIIHIKSAHIGHDLNSACHLLSIPGLITYVMPSTLSYGVPVFILVFVGCTPGRWGLASLLLSWHPSPVALICGGKGLSLVILSYGLLDDGNFQWVAFGEKLVNMSQLQGGWWKYSIRGVNQEQNTNRTMIIVS